MKLKQITGTPKEIQARMFDGDVFYSATGKTKFYFNGLYLMASENGDEVGMYAESPISDGMFYELVEDNE